MATTNMGFEVPTETKRSNAPITNDGFFVDLNLLEFSEMYAVPKTIENTLLKTKLLNAIDDVNQTLDGFKQGSIAQGHATLAAVPSPQIDGQSTKVIQYKKAVYCQAMVELIQADINLARTADAENKATSAKSNFDFYREQKSRAIARLQGETSYGVYLI